MFRIFKGSGSLRVTHFSHSDFFSGADRAAYRVHRALIAHNIDSSMEVLLKRSGDWRVDQTEGNVAKAIKYWLRNTYLFGHSSARFSSFHSKRINVSDADVVNLHSICGGVLSVEEIGRITKPVVWTLHDMWAFCGGEHYTSNAENARWRQGYSRLNCDAAHRGLDVDRWVWKRKQKSWKRPFHLICPSRWLADCARASPLLHKCPLTVVPHVLDTRIFGPRPKNVARESLGLPRNTTLVLFGAWDVGDHRKGWDLFRIALAHVAKTIPETQVVILGSDEPPDPFAIGLNLAFGLRLHWMGRLHDAASLALLYSAVDVTVVPSRQEAFGQIGSEAQACGCPVVTFNTSGLTDIVEHGCTGYLAEAYSTDDLAKGIEWVLSDRDRHARLSAAARERALKLWSQDIVVPQYLEVYRQAMEQQMA